MSLFYSPTDSTACKEDEFRCISTGRCIPSTWQCDRTVDCLDHSDETDCAGMLHSCVF